MIKLFTGPSNNPLFPNDPASEILALQHLETQGIAPRFVDHFQVGSDTCLVYEHLPGQGWQAGAAKVAELLYRVHQLPPPQNLRRAANGSLALQHQTRTILAACPKPRARDLHMLAPTEHASGNGPSRFLHGDPVPANIIAHTETLRLIDWQCPATGDPCEDISIFLSPAMQVTYRGAVLRTKEVDAFLTAYPDQQVIKRYHRLAPWYHWRMAAYCLWQECRGDPVARRAGAAEIDALQASIAAQEDAVYSV